MYSIPIICEQLNNYYNLQYDKFNLKFLAKYPNNYINDSCV